MVFSSPVFMFLFLPATFMAYYIMPKRFRNGWLLVVSLLFYAWGEPVYVFLMLASIMGNYLLAARASENKAVAVFAVVFNIGLLVVFKYSDFILSNINLLGAGLPLPGIRLPIGISFFTFQALSYVIDVYRGEVPARKDFLGVALYISFFPQLIAGPIIRYGDIAGQIDAREESMDDITFGIKRFIIGFSKKMLLANWFSVIADTAFSQPPAALSAPAAWLGVIAYAFQMYFDFSGYSCMAIGLGRIFGFKIPENFNAPYISDSVSAFWKRWHISLSAWFRNYVYLPLSMKLRGKTWAYINLMVVFALTGLWHGASWNFLVFGLFHGFFLTVERLLPKRLRPRKAWGHIYTLLVVLVAFVIFRSETLPGALEYLKAMAGFSSPDAHSALVLGQALTPAALCFYALGAAACLPLGRAGAFSWITRTRFVWAAMFVLFGLSVLALSAGTYNPFIYFRF